VADLAGPIAAPEDAPSISNIRYPPLIVPRVPRQGHRLRPRGDRTLAGAAPHAGGPVHRLRTSVESFHGPGDRTGFARRSEGAPQLPGRSGPHRTSDEDRVAPVEIVGRGTSSGLRTRSIPIGANAGADSHGGSSVGDRRTGDFFTEPGMHADRGAHPSHPPPRATSDWSNASAPRLAHVADDVVFDDHLEPFGGIVILPIDAIRAVPPWERGSGTERGRSPSDRDRCR